MNDGAPVEPAAFLVRQEAFEGTLGELAWALRKGTVRPGQIDLLALVSDFLDHFRSLSARNLDLASQALPGVAQVIELKLRLLLPRQPREADEEEEELLEETLAAVAQMEELEDAIEFLRQRRLERRVVLPARAPRPDYPRPSRPLANGVQELVRIASRYNPSSYFELAIDRLSMGAAIERLMNRLRLRRRVRLSDLPEAGSWSELAVYFAGMLELVRQGSVTASQEGPYAEIDLEVVDVAQAREVA